MAEVNVKELAAYIQKKYYEEKQKEISPIKLQKTLYFLFAYWGGTVRKSKLYPKSVEEDFSKFNEYLFDEDIEAWVYGPVVPVVYHEKNLQRYFKEDLFNGKEQLKEFIDGLLKELFEVSDFTLVELSHNDNAWKKHFSYDDEFHNNSISKEDKVIPLSAAMFIFYGDEVVYMFGGSYDEYLNFLGQYRIQWELICYAAKHKYKRYNFYGIKDLNLKGAKEDGVLKFKQNFNGYILELIGPYSLAINKMIYSLEKVYTRIRGK